MSKRFSMYSGVLYNRGDSMNVAEVAPTSGRHLDVDLTSDFLLKSKKNLGTTIYITGHQSTVL